jgi:hypothetical protein
MKIFEDGIQREATADEIAAIELRSAENLKEQKAQDKAKADKVAARQAVLDKLGLTADEAAALLG